MGGVPYGATFDYGGQQPENGVVERGAVLLGRLKRIAKVNGQRTSGRFIARCVRRSKRLAVAILRCFGGVHPPNVTSFGALDSSPVERGQRSTLTEASTVRGEPR